MIAAKSDEAKQLTEGKLKADNATDSPLQGERALARRPAAART